MRMYNSRKKKKKKKSITGYNSYNDIREKERPVKIQEWPITLTVERGTVKEKTGEKKRGSVH